MGDHSQSQGHLGKSRVDMTLSRGCTGWGQGNQVQQSAGPKVQTVVTKMVGLYRAWQPSPWAGEFGVGAAGLQPGVSFNMLVLRAAERTWPSGLL